jgi:hypothetical protein
MEVITIEREKHRFSAPGVRFQINENQHVLLIGFNGILSDEHLVTFEIDPGFKANSVGYLRDQEPIFKKILDNSLQNAGWNFAQFINPIVIMLNRKHDRVSLPSSQNHAFKVINQN